MGPQYFRMDASEYLRHAHAAYEDKRLMAAVATAARQLETEGYGVVPAVLSPEECEEIHSQFWEAMGTASGGRLKRPRCAEDLAGFKATTDWPPNVHGVLEDGAYAHLPFVYNVRTHPKVAVAFALLYGTGRRLVVAADRIQYQLPHEWLPRARSVDPCSASERDAGGNCQYPLSDAQWLHVDQHPSRMGRHCIQGLVQITSAEHDGDASLEVVPGSHHKFSRLEVLLGRSVPAQGSRKDWVKFSDAEKQSPQLAGERLISVRAPRGSLLLWDSRTWHQGGRVRHRRPDPEPRFAIYVCMQPVLDPAGLPDAEVDRKRKAFREGRATSHWPLRTVLFGGPRWKTGLVPDLVSHRVTAPERLPVLAHFFGLNQRPDWDVLPPGFQGRPLLAFHHSSGVSLPVPPPKRVHSVLSSPDTSDDDAATFRPALHAHTR